MILWLTPQIPVMCCGYVLNNYPYLFKRSQDTVMISWFWHAHFIMPVLLFTAFWEEVVLLYSLSKYLLKLNLCDSGINLRPFDYPREAFLREIFSSLKSEETLVNVLLHEFHVKRKLTYTAGKLHGIPINYNEPASTWQAFMISLILLPNKHTAVLYPVSNLTAYVLLQLTQKVLTFLHNTGYKVISLISDNNRINRTMFQKIMLRTSD